MTGDTDLSVDKSSQAAQPVLRVVLRTMVHNEAGGQAAAPLLSEAERQRAARFAFDRDRWSYTAAHSLLRTMLAEYHGLPPLAWQFRHNSHGRPEIDPAMAPATTPRFNISHTHGMAACALTAGPLPEGVEIGVDAECLNRSPASRSLARRFFSSREAQWLDAQPQSHVDSEFLRLWTLKEAVAKAAGLGFGLDFQAFHCTIDPLSVCFETPDWGPSEAWELNNWFVEPCHWVSLAVRRPPGTRLKLHIQHLSSANFPSPA